MIAQIILNIFMFILSQFSRPADAVHRKLLQTGPDVDDTPVEFVAFGCWEK
jgi:hypothetical protein